MSTSNFSDMVITNSQLYVTPDAVHISLMKCIVHQNPIKVEATSLYVTRRITLEFKVYVMNAPVAM